MVSPRAIGHTSPRTPPPTWSIQSLPTMMLCTVEVLFLHT